MPRGTRQKNIRKLEQAITHIDKAKEHVDQVAVQYQAGYAHHAFDLAVISQGLDVARDILEVYGPEALPVLSTFLETVAGMIEVKKRLE